MSIETGIVTGDSLVVPKPSISTDNHGNPAFNRPITIFSGMYPFPIITVNV